jgi:exonuclease V
MQPAGAEEEVEVDLTNGQARKPRKPEKPDIRTPIERFRRPPKKPLSVTDIVSPAWCELQYLYSLTKFGRVKRTPAMKQGSKVHKELESQVHTYVEIEVKTREDTFGLRIWNIIQGLRTLRATGLTRELETWGVLDGEVVNGIIDELSFECPDPELEASIELARESDNLPPGQTTISDFYASQQNPHSAWLGNPHPTRKVYLSDIKTRGTRYMPKGAALRGTQMQLMLYHRLLSDLASNMVHADTVFARYNLNAHTPFSPSFIGAIASLDDNFIHTTAVDDSEVEFNTLEDQFSELAAHNSLTLLWSLMITEFALILPTPNLSLSPILQAEFRASATGKVIGSHTFVYDSRVLERYVGKTMDWWMGRREARGVDIEEAFKCGVCEFAPGCEWRESKVEEGVRRFREKKRVGGRKWVV